MRDLIDRQAAIKAIEDLQDCYNGFSDTYDKACIIGALEEVPSAQPEYCLDEWCTECKEYDHERHCCPRFNHVIRTTLQEMKEEQVERKKGKWVREDGIAHGIVSRVVKCSLCGKNAGLSEEGFWHLSDFCPNCGTRMEEQE